MNSIENKSWLPSIADSNSISRFGKITQPHEIVTTVCNTNIRKEMQQNVWSAHVLLSVADERFEAAMKLGDILFWTSQQNNSKKAHNKSNVRRETTRDVMHPIRCHRSSLSLSYSHTTTKCFTVLNFISQIFSKLWCEAQQTPPPAAT